MSCGKSGLAVLMGFELATGFIVGSLYSLYIYLYDYQPHCNSDVTFFLYPYPLFMAEYSHLDFNIHVSGFRVKG